jgi:hypothetical protein
MKIRSQQQIVFVRTLISLEGYKYALYTVRFWNGKNSKTAPKVLFGQNGSANATWPWPLANPVGHNIASNIAQFSGIVQVMDILFLKCNKLKGITFLLRFAV